MRHRLYETRLDESSGLWLSRCDCGWREYSATEERARQETAAHDMDDVVWRDRKDARDIRWRGPDEGAS